MVYCDQDMCESKLGRLMQAFRADRPSEWLMDDFICMAEQMNKEIELLRQAEKDAARYRWLRNCDTKQTGRLVENGHIVGFGVLDAKIDEAMQCNK